MLKVAKAVLDFYDVLSPVQQLVRPNIDNNHENKYYWEEQYRRYFETAHSLKLIWIASSENTLIDISSDENRKIESIINRPVKWRENIGNQDENCWFRNLRSDEGTNAIDKNHGDAYGNFWPLISSSRWKVYFWMLWTILAIYWSRSWRDEIIIWQTSSIK